MKKQLFAIMLSLALLLGLTACTAAPNIQAPDTQTDPQATVPDAGQTGQAEDGEQSPQMILAREKIFPWGRPPTTLRMSLSSSMTKASRNL